MNKAWLIYTLLRLGVFAVALSIMLLLGYNPYVATGLAAIVALSISLLFFGKQRNAASTALYESRNKNKDADAEVEDAKLADGDDA
ncbi:MAG: hypothetical protein RLZZ164_805 [Actinomycetota bacterium]